MPIGFISTAANSSVGTSRFDHTHGCIVHLESACRAIAERKRNIHLVMENLVPS